jgi:Putative zinc-finger
MNETFCTYSGKRDEVIVSYLYGEMETDDRVAFDRHLLACAPCRAELADLHDVRSELTRWAPPEPALQVPLNIGIPERAVDPGVVKRAGTVPVWAQAIAATLLVGVAAGIANLDVSYSAASGLSVRTGWKHAEPVPAPAVTATVPASAVVASTVPAPWASDLATLERELRAEMQTRPVATTIAATSGNDEGVLRRVRQLVDDSERRQQSELALRMAEAMRELQVQRQADLVKIDRTLGVMQNRTGLEVMRTQRQMNSLAQQVSQRP